MHRPRPRLEAGHRHPSRAERRPRLFRWSRWRGSVWRRRVFAAHPRILSLAINIVRGSEFLCEWPLVWTSCDRGRPNPSSRELNAEVAESADAEDCDEVSWASAGIPQGIKRGDPRAEQGPGIGGGNLVRNGGESAAPEVSMYSGVAAVAE